MSEESLFQGSDVYESAMSMIKMLNKDASIDLIASTLQESDKGVSMVLLKKALQRYGNCPITEFLNIHKKHIDGSKELTEDQIQNIEAYLKANIPDDDSLILPDSILFEFIENDKQLFANIYDILQYKDLSIHCISSFHVRESEPSILLIGSPKKVWLIDLLAIQRDTGNQITFNAIYELITEKSNHLIYLHKDKHFAKMEKAFPLMPAFQKCNNALDIYEFIETNYHIKINTLSLSSLLYVFTGLYLDNHQYKSDWNIRPLTFFQFHYAATYAYALILIHTFVCQHPSWNELDTSIKDRYEEILSKKNPVKKVKQNSSNSSKFMNPKSINTIHSIFLQDNIQSKYYENPMNVSIMNPFMEDKNANVTTSPSSLSTTSERDYRESVFLTKDPIYDTTHTSLFMHDYPLYKDINPSMYYDSIYMDAPRQTYSPEHTYNTYEHNYSNTYIHRDTRREYKQKPSLNYTPTPIYKNRDFYPYDQYHYNDSHELYYPEENYSSIPVDSYSMNINLYTRHTHRTKNQRTYYERY